VVRIKTGDTHEMAVVEKKSVAAWGPSTETVSEKNCRCSFVLPEVGIASETGVP